MLLGSLGASLVNLGPGKLRVTHCLSCLLFCFPTAHSVLRVKPKRGQVGGLKNANQIQPDTLTKVQYNEDCEEIAMVASLRIDVRGKLAEHVVSLAGNIGHNIANVSPCK